VIGVFSIPCLHSAIGEDAMVAIETCGYAAPVDDCDTPPSIHPQRRRVRLIIVANRDGDIGSALEFSDDPDEPTTTPTGQGQLVIESRSARPRSPVDFARATASRMRRGSWRRSMSWTPSSHICRMSFVMTTRSTVSSSLWPMRRCIPEKSTFGDTN